MPQMKRKGRVQVGADADLVVFDAATVLGSRNLHAAQPDRHGHALRHRQRDRGDSRWGTCPKRCRGGPSAGLPPPPRGRCLNPAQANPLPSSSPRPPPTPSLLVGTHPLSSLSNPPPLLCHHLVDCAVLPGAWASCSVIVRSLVTRPPPPRPPDSRLSPPTPLPPPLSTPPQNRRPRRNCEEL